ncbi:carbohydrate-binding domain-containing protein [Micromonospora sp. NPDC007230]|uniref:carbohydrate-binding domain-containing protein n=1 Tax=Micromonospora sp. NPDC007230 TaxID=3364237 RepID=UPI0036857416
MTNATRAIFLASALAALVLSISPPALAAGGRLPDAAPVAAPAPVSRDTVPDSVAVVPSAEGIHVLDVSSSIITLASGDTFIYTVDTPEGQGRTTLEVKTVDQLLNEITAKDGSAQTYTVEDSQGAQKQATDRVVPGDVLTVTAGHTTHQYTIDIVKGAVRGQLELQHDAITANTASDVVLNFTSGMRSPATDVRVKVPRGIRATMDNTTVNVIGRGEVRLSGLATQSVGRVAAGYRFQQVGTATIEDARDGSQVITFRGLDLRPSNGADLQIRFTHVSVKQGSYSFEASYTTSEPEKLRSPAVTATLQAVKTVSDFRRVLDKSLTYRETPDTYTKARLRWTAPQHAVSVRLLQSTDQGATWTQSNATVDRRAGEVEVKGLTPNTEYDFKLDVRGGENHGESNVASFFAGKLNAKLMGVKGDGLADDTEAINRAIRYLNEIGGGTLLFENGTFNVRTVHLLSNVYLYVDRDATVSAIKGADAPEALYFSDKAYRSGTSPTDPGPYEDPENYTTKQDVGHTYFRNSMFFGERVDNVKIIGNGRITGNGNIVTTDKVMDNAPDLRADKMVTLKLSTNVEFGGLDNGLDLWYEETNSPTTDQPYYIKSLRKDGTTESKQTDISNMLRVDNAGHFALLATGTDHINTHDFYYDKGKGGQARDVFDYMGSSYVTARNIYAKGTSDDIVKPGSDSSLGFTRPATDFYVRNIIGDTNCNLFQIGSETADDIRNAYVDNIYVLAGNKAGFSISTNDGATVENIYLNSGKTGPVHHQAQMRRTRAPFFISISNRGRVIGGQAQRTKFWENGVQRDELLSTNVNIGHVRNVHIKDVNIEEVYGGSQYSDPSKRWVPYTNQNKATPIIAGYKVGEGGPALPDGRTIGYVENVTFENVNVLVKGGNSYEDSQVSPPELGVGKYNVADFGVQPSYGFWARHVQGLSFKNVTTNFERNDDRYAFVLDDVKNAELDGLTMVRGRNNPSVIELKNASNITVRNSAFYDGTWGNELTPLQDLTNVTVSDAQAYPPRVKDPHNTAIQLKRSGHENVTDLNTETMVVTTVLGSTTADLTTQIESTDGTAQTYAVTDPDGRPRSAEALIDTGDILAVTAEDGMTRAEYRIAVSPDLVIEGESQLGSVERSVPSITLSTSSTNGRTYLQTSSVPAGEWIQFLVDVPVAGTYDVSYQYKTNTSGRATVQAYVDGVASGAAVDQNSSTANQYIPVNLGRVTFANAGQHPIRFEAVKPGSIVIDYIKLTKVVGGQAD